MKSLTESFKTLKIDVDMVLHYFFWVGMNETFQTQLIHITNETKPSLKDMNSKFFDATERYLRVVKNNSKLKRQNEVHDTPLESKETSSMAVNLNMKPQKFKNCYLCTQSNGAEENHPIYRCPVYADPKAKVDRLKSLNACLKCASITNRCKFRFKHRCSCKKWHFTFLCLNTTPEKDTSNNSLESPGPSSPSQPLSNDVQKKKKGTKSNETTSNVNVTIDALPNISDGNSVLPTFSCFLNDNYQIRVLKDLGCQRNFIKSSIATSQNLKVIRDNAKLRVKGFNSDIDYNTQIVELHLTIGTKTYVISAICVLEIRINISLPNLPVISSNFNKKRLQVGGYIFVEWHFVNI